EACGCLRASRQEVAVVGRASCAVAGIEPAQGVGRMPGAERPRALSLDTADARLVRVGGNEARIEADQIVHACIERVQRPGGGGKALRETDFGRARGLRTQRRMREAREVEIGAARRSKGAPE